MAALWQVDRGHSSLRILALFTVILAACDGRDAAPAQAEFGYTSAHRDELSVYHAASPWASVLADCLLVNTVAEACTLAELPLIGATRVRPEIDDVLDRVLVSHSWMGERFEEVLQRAPPELLDMFGSVTSVLIGTRVRPSFYTSLTGAMQIDPDFLWQSVAEKRTVSLAEDFRVDFGRDLGFRFLQRPLIGDQPAFTLYSLADDSEREFDDIRIPVMSLLFHELAHALDYVPIDQAGALDVSLKFFDAVAELAPYWLSTRAEINLPALDGRLKRLAGIRFAGASATAADRLVSASEVGQWMNSDGSMKFYSYLTTREDIATLLEATLMQYHYQVRLNIGVVDTPTEPDSVACEDYVLDWGVRNRLAQPAVAARARWLLEEALGTRSGYEEFFTEDIGESVPLPTGIDWCTAHAATLARKEDGAASARIPEPDRRPVFDERAH